jgi:uncharacterized protein (DUF58 family)
MCTSCPRAPASCSAPRCSCCWWPSINYQLNLGYLLTFLLAGSAVVGMHVCHGTLRGLTMNLIAPEPQFMGASATFGIKLVNSRRTVRHGIGLAVLDSTHADHWAWTDVPAQGTSTVQVAFRPARRGLQRVPPLTAETRFPLGTFRVWTVWRPAAQCWSTRRPSLPAAAAAGRAAQRRRGRARQQTTGEFDGVRGYRRGDPLKLVVWKKAASAMARGSDELVSRDTQQTQRYELWLDFALAAARQPDTEGTGCRACAPGCCRPTSWAWTTACACPGVEIKPASGEAHKRRCLEALALC